MNKLDIQYLSILEDILNNGHHKNDRTGTGTYSIFGKEIIHNMDDGFPLLTTKKVAFKTMVTELLWFLRGDTNIKYLVENKSYIWNGDAYKNYITKYNFLSKKDKKKYGKLYENNYHYFTKDEFTKKIRNDNSFSKMWGDMGNIYGKQWRNWNGIDQISNLINDLIKNPDSRRLMLNSWNVNDLDNMVLPPCHYGFQCYTYEMTETERMTRYKMKYYNNKEITEKYLDNINFPKRKLSLKWNQRSCDFPLGIPMNISSYGLLLIIISKIVNMIPDKLIGSFGDCHIYTNQIDGVKQQLRNTNDYYLPNIKFNENINFSSIEKFLITCTKDDIILENYDSNDKIYFPLSN